MTQPIAPITSSAPPNPHTSCLKKILSQHNVKIMRAALIIIAKVALVAAATSILISFSFFYVSPLILGHPIATKAIVKFGIFIFFNIVEINILVALVRKTSNYVAKRRKPITLSTAAPPIPSPIPQPTATISQPPSQPIAVISSPPSPILAGTSSPSISTASPAPTVSTTTAVTIKTSPSDSPLVILNDKSPSPPASSPVSQQHSPADSPNSSGKKLSGEYEILPLADV